MSRVAVLAVIASACWRTPTPTTVQSRVVQDKPDPSTDVIAFPAGPFRSSTSFCDHWKAAQPELAPDADAEGVSCRPWYGCDVHAERVRSPASVSAVEIIERRTDSCSLATCLLAIDTPRGVWIADTVSDCFGGEGTPASLTTTAVLSQAGTLVWTLDHHVNFGSDVQTVITLRCTPDDFHCAMEEVDANPAP